MRRLERSAPNRDEIAVVEFAVRWAPFGGPPAEDLLIRFGTNRDRFFHFLRHTLQRHLGVSNEIDHITRHLPESWGPEEVFDHLRACQTERPSNS